MGFSDSFNITDSYFEFFTNLSVKINHIKELLRVSFHWACHTSRLSHQDAK